MTGLSGPVRNAGHGERTADPVRTVVAVSRPTGEVEDSRAPVGLCSPGLCTTWFRWTTPPRSRPRADGGEGRES